MLCVLAIAFCFAAPAGAAQRDDLRLAQLAPHVAGAYDPRILPPRSAPGLEGPVDFTRPGLQRNRPWPRHPATGG
ncbi:hypothetical protein [Neomegalonema sp.]|uniref:hypothetical protein n=1 Tax=Neomegalonema sp. TaxID=2039713 RepID=UPI00260E24DF|nr:hypothetical protein [Neomegalonema sp.]MDD2868058.1 hypothetical protein [Neomegalonema sp.]